MWGGGHENSEDEGTAEDQAFYRWSDKPLSEESGWEEVEAPLSTL